MELAEKNGFNIGTIIMNGLGNDLDLIKSLLYLKRFKNLKYLYISTFHPVLGTPWENRNKASIYDSIRLVSIARLIYPNVNIGLADVEVETGSLSKFLSLELSSGAGNTLAGILVYKKRISNYIENIKTLSSPHLTLQS